jgi:hypothetical protein
MVIQVSGTRAMTSMTGMAGSLTQPSQHLCPALEVRVSLKYGDSGIQGYIDDFHDRQGRIMDTLLTYGQVNTFVQRWR